MPPKVRFEKKDIINAAFALAREKGIDAVNARSVASEIGCSTQPIFRVFENMDQLKECVLDCAVQQFIAYVDGSRSTSETEYESIGMAYLMFALEEPNLFHMVFMYKRDGAIKDVLSNKGKVICALVEKTSFTQEQAGIIRRHMLTHTYGLAAMMATGQVEYTREELHELLILEYRAIVAALLWEDAKSIMPPV